MRQNLLTQLLIFLLFFLQIVLFSCNEAQINKLLYKEVDTGYALAPTMRDSTLKQMATDTLQAQIKAGKHLVKLKTNNKESARYEIDRFYQERDHQPAWTNPLTSSLSEQAKSYLTELKKAPSHGLKPENYLLKEIETLQSAINDTYGPATEAIHQQLAELDLLLTSSFMAYTTDLLKGEFKPKGIWEVIIREKNLTELLQKALEKKGDLAASIKAVCPKHEGYWQMAEKLGGYHQAVTDGTWKEISSKAKLSKESSSEDVAQLANRLVAMGDLPKKYANQKKYDNNIAKAVKNYQKRHYLSQTGTINGETRKTLNVPAKTRMERMRLALNRYRWLPEDLGNRHVWMNIPEFMTYVVEKGDTVASIISVVGANKDATPILINKPLQNIILSPTWTIPRSIALEEIEYIRKDPAVLIVADVDVFLDGKKVDPRGINWKTVNMKRVKLRQRPKRRNSMGRAKFMFTNNHSIYLHDTPNQVDFNKKRRSESHGCVRVKEPKLLATKLLSGKKGWNSGRIGSAMASGKEQYVKPPVPVKVHIAYFTTYVDRSGNLRFIGDVYGHDRRQLKQQGGI